MTRFRKSLIAVAAAAVATTILAAPALAQPNTGVIGPKQYFAGQVNGNSGHSVLSVQGCPPAAAGNANGVVLPGQTVEVEQFLVPPPGPGGNIVGYTGRAHKISADLQVALAEPPLIYQVHLADLSAYNSPASIPYQLSVPCNATITAVFTPVNGGPKAAISQVSLTVAGPKIVPNHTQVTPGEMITLNGSGFVPNLTYNVEECSETAWLVVQTPCVKSNSISVTTSSSGAFTAPFVAQACVPSTAVISTCYIGAPVPTGVDEIYLAGAATIHVV